MSDFDQDKLYTHRRGAKLSEAQQLRVSDPPSENICIHSAVVEHQ